MNRKTLRGVIVVAGILGAAGIAGGVLFFEREENDVSVPNTAAAEITADELSAAATKRLYFGHMSVGNNILDGISDVYRQRGIDAPSLVKLDPVDPRAGSEAPAETAGEGVVLHAEIGVNGDPLGKLRNFDAALRSGLAADVDVALLKFCYVDIGADTDVVGLFDAYSTTMTALEEDYPEVTFLYATAPLTVSEPGLKGVVKAVLGRTDNPARERYNTLVRQAYGDTGRLFDIAAVEATPPDGTPTAALYPGYASDGAHLNAGGSATVAVALLHLLARAE